MKRCRLTSFFTPILCFVRAGSSLPTPDSQEKFPNLTVLLLLNFTCLYNRNTVYL